MLRFSRMTFQQNITNISELLPYPWGMDKRPCIATLHPGLENFPTSEENGKLFQRNEFEIRE
jgi:hypothetical protein